jgi:hypothetical protein
VANIAVALGTGGCDDTKTVDVIIGDIESPIPDLATLPILTGIVILS